MSRRTGIVVFGRVTEPLPNGLFRIELDNGQQITAHFSGRARMNLVRILPGDRVRVEMTTLDLTRGRIIDRLRST